MPDPVNGYILTAHAGDSGGRCELLCFGTGEQGPFRLSFPGHTPLFFIRRTSRIPPLTGMTRKPVELTDFSGNPVDALYFRSLEHYYNGRKSLRDLSVPVYESDIKPVERFLMERHIYASLEITGPADVTNKLLHWTNPKLACGKPDYRPALNWLSLDIETGRDGSVYSIALHGTEGARERKLVLIRAEQKTLTANDSLIPYPSEREMLAGMLATVKDWDPDLIIGWHVIGFDLSFLEKRYQHYHIPFLLGRGLRTAKITQRPGGLYDAEIEGRIVIDGPPSLRAAFFKFKNYKLETVAMELLGRGKDITPEENKVAEIERRFHEDKQALARYNLEDCILVTEIFKKTGIVDLLLTRSLITGLPMDRVSMSVAAFDHFMLPAVHRFGMVAPDTEDLPQGVHSAGGYVFSTDAGLYNHVVVLDFKSLYPTIIKTFFIDPVSRLRKHINPVNTPVGIAFSRTEHALPAFLDELMAKRAQAKKTGAAHLAQAVKILMNSFYGVMGTTGCRFYHPELPTAITGTGQWVLKNTVQYLTTLGYRVIYGDTDSVFVCLKEEEYARPDQTGKELEEKINLHFQSVMREEFQAVSRLEMEFEKHYIRFFLPGMRGSREGARKRYVGQHPDGTLELKGMEYVRSDWTDLAREFQYELFRRYFGNEDLKSWIKDTIALLKGGKLDEKLVYRRKLNRRAEDYTKTTPPHVKAVRMLDPDGKKDIREISYVITPQGAIPLELKPERIDYQHYIEKQLKPIAEGILIFTGEDFDSLIEGRQLELF